MKYVLACLTLVAAFTLAHADEKSDALQLGKAAYEQHCVRCHGDQGLGNGPDAKRVPVTPRNFTRGAFKFRTTASGTPPSDDDLMYVINHGLSGSGMPSFANLGLDVKKALVEYVKSFSKEFETYQPQVLATPNQKAKYDPQRGKEIYDKLQCALCHGNAGRANGTSAPTLVDSWGAPIKAANLNQEWTYRAGASAKDIYYRLMSGIAGTPMPSYDGAISADEAWQLSQYVVSLQQHANWSYNVIASKTNQPLPTTVDDAAWNSAARSDVTLQSSYYTGNVRHFGTVNAVAVQALANGKDVAFRISWNDPTKSSADQLAVAFLPNDKKGAARPPLTTLSAESSQAEVVLWSPSSKITSSYEDGLWTIVFTRPMSGTEIPIGFAAWDGGNNESGLKRSVSQWVPLMLGDVKPSHH